jgi:hypothetical protein
LEHLYEAIPIGRVRFIGLITSNWLSSGYNYFWYPSSGPLEIPSDPFSKR